MGIFKNKMKIF